MTMEDDELAFVVGFDLGSVARHARQDLGWERVSVTRWIDNDGREVRYVSSADTFGSYTCTRLYMVGDYQEREDFHEIDDYIRQHRLQCHFL